MLKTSQGFLYVLLAAKTTTCTNYTQNNNNSLSTSQGKSDRDDKLVYVHGSCRLKSDTGRDICSPLCASACQQKYHHMSNKVTTYYLLSHRNNHQKEALQ